MLYAACEKGSVVHSSVDELTFSIILRETMSNCELLEKKVIALDNRQLSAPTLLRVIVGVKLSSSASKSRSSS